MDGEDKSSERVERDSDACCGVFVDMYALGILNLGASCTWMIVARHLIDMFGLRFGSISDFTSALRARVSGARGCVPQLPVRFNDRNGIASQQPIHDTESVCALNSQIMVPFRKFCSHESK